ncbi:MAG: alternative ribosome rescue aminoacyl-tRNA hydrolase ArfB [Myxococcota bacterium]
MGRGDLEIHRSLVLPAAEIVESASRAGGPGGQHVNKTSTRVTLRWNVAASEALTSDQRRRLLRRLAARLTRKGHLVIHARGTRSRAQNRKAARERLAEIVREALRAPRPRVATRVSLPARERRLREKKRRGQIKRKRGRPRDTD